MLEQERQYYAKHLPEWLAQSRGMIVLVKGETLIGMFDTYNDALSEGARRFGLSSVLVRRVEEPQEDVCIPALSLGLINANSTHPI